MAFVACIPLLGHDVGVDAAQSYALRVGQVYDAVCILECIQIHAGKDHLHLVFGNVPVVHFIDFQNDSHGRRVFIQDFQAVEAIVHFCNADE
eukprot:CAMPEP_0116897302 /NCGR_PEP_ID=MMETSP0467-20121206/6327_1 /TAXON_ID=283647 /ORGANISM="Mesodinium pulex, Strain SPMC105" /LENGTH=91 /DNA_ID=CAMNT_0004568899 /DNA_START=229 /DNA_END=504 /DNA_ORIENTATION=-